MRLKPLHLLLGAAGAGLAYALLHKPARFIGDKAQNGDEVFASITSLPAPVPGLPQGAGAVDVKVTSTTDDSVSGMVIAYIIHELPTVQSVALPIPIGPISIPRSTITSVFRSGKQVS